MNTPNTIAPSRTELPGGYGIEHFEKVNGLGITERRVCLVSPDGCAVADLNTTGAHLHAFVAAMNRPSPQQAPVRSVEVQECFESIDGGFALTNNRARTLLAYIATLEAQPPAAP
ncbi:hypothetical protein [Bradyrhizobium manausense]|uniref:hypothetical protein n=1 Tax=Bradyrhizobium manausense TaxID=989370 RepID=UPI001BA7B204|nr:hypothetical protein [Bradyrhizobium manausense]MBR0721806.1 hypothetical protein [Bradyrhizobium manausense]